MSLKVAAREIFLQTLRKVRLEEVMRARVRCVEGTLHVGNLRYKLAAFRRVVVISIGKAAGPMSDAMVGLLDGECPLLEGIVVGATAPERVNGRIQSYQGSHPLPNEGARAAARAVLAALEGCDAECLVVFQISGGASAMVEWALDDGMTPADEAEFYGALVRSGLAIGEMNALRKHFSRVKGGRLAVAAGEATQCTLLVSDVPEGMLDVIGSGPSLPDRSTVEQCRRILREHREALGLSAKVQAFFDGPGLVETPKAGDAPFARAEWLSVLWSYDLCAAAKVIAEEMGFHAVIDNGCDEWEYRAAAEYLVGKLRELRAVHGPVCLISGGEVSVRVSGAHGMGGRNQQIALECARRLGAEGLRAAALSGGSDGVDGNSPAAGGVVDETTVMRAGGLRVEEALAGFDAYPLLAALGDAIVTGPTGNNVRDPRILLSEG